MATVTFGLQFVGANDAALTGVDLQPGVCNYFLGSDPDAWVTGATTFGGVVYEDLYEGIDLHCRGSADGLKYDFWLSPGSDPAQILLS